MHTSPADNTVFFRQYGESVRFENASDAKIASLALVHNLSVTAIDLFLDVLRDDDFSIGDLTLRSGSDIYSHIGDQYRKQAVTLSENRLDFSRGQAVRDGAAQSSLVVKLITDELIRRWEWELANMQWCIHSAKDSLASMSLVCRTWRIASQRALGSILELQEGVDIRNVLCSPIFGPWTRRARIELGFTAGQGNREILKRMHVQEQSQLYVGAFRRYCNLRLVTMLLISLKDTRDEYPAQLCIRGLSLASNLQGLFIHFEEAIRGLLVQTAQTLTNLANLREFTLSLEYSGFAKNNDSSYMHNDDAQALMDLSGPSSTLQNLTFIVLYLSGFKHAIPFLNWILLPRQSYAITSFSVHIPYASVTDMNSTNDQLIAVIAPNLSFLEVFEIHAKFEFFEASEQGDRNMADAFFRQLLPRCTRLRRIAYCHNLLCQHRNLPPLFAAALGYAPKTLQEVLGANRHEASLGEQPKCNFLRSSVPLPRIMEGISSSVDL
jgi:hypothetical protein